MFIKLYFGVLLSFVCGLAYGENSVSTDTPEERPQGLFNARGYPKPMDIPLLNRQIFKGKRVSIMEHPYVVSVRRQYVHYVVGSLITQNLIITCAQHLLGVSVHELGVVVGENYSDRGTTLFTVLLVIIHEEFDPYTLQADLALIRIYGDYVLKYSMKHISIGMHEVSNGDKAFVTGWGRCDLTDSELCLPRSSLYFPDEKIDPMLKTISFTVNLPNFYCEGYKEHGVKIPNGTMCLGPAREESSVCSCMAVPGAPLVVKALLVGIQSWGIACGYSYDLPIIYTSIYHHTKWISNNMKIMLNVTSTDLHLLYLATKAYSMTHLLEKTRVHSPLSKKFTETKIRALDIDSELAKLSGNVYDIRDFIGQNMFNYAKMELYQSLKNISKKKSRKKQLKSQTKSFLNDTIQEESTHFTDIEDEAED